MLNVKSQFVTEGEKNPYKIENDTMKKKEKHSFSMCSPYYTLGKNNTSNVWRKSCSSAHSNWTLPHNYWVRKEKATLISLEFISQEMTGRG